MSSSVSDRVRHLCELAGEPRVHLSALCGLAGSHLGLIVNQRTDALRSTTLVKICNTFGCSPTWLVSGTGRAPSKKSVSAALARKRLLAADESRAA